MRPLSCLCSMGSWWDSSADWDSWDSWEASASQAWQGESTHRHGSAAPRRRWPREPSVQSSSSQAWSSWEPKGHWAPPSVPWKAHPAELAATESEAALTFSTTAGRPKQGYCACRSFALAHVAKWRPFAGPPPPPAVIPPDCPALALPTPRPWEAFVSNNHSRPIAHHGSGKVAPAGLYKNPPKPYPFGASASGALIAKPPPPRPPSSGATSPMTPLIVKECVANTVNSAAPAPLRISALMW